MIVHHSSKKLTVVPALMKISLEPTNSQYLMSLLTVHYPSGSIMQNLTAKAATSLYALKALKSHGLQGRALCDTTQATLVLWPK